MASPSNFKDTRNNSQSRIIYTNTHTHISTFTLLPCVRCPYLQISATGHSSAAESTMSIGDGDDDHKNPYSLNSKIMVTAIISLTIVIVVVLLLHIYARCVLRRQARRRSVIRSLDLVNNRVTHSTETPPPPKTGLDPTVIAALPIFVYKQTDGGQDDGLAAAIECAVCLSNLENEEMARVLPNCNHTFHSECIDKWLGSHSTCPICRTGAEPRPQPESREGPVSVAPTAPPLLVSAEGTSSNSGNNNGVEANSAKVTAGSSSRLSSFRRILNGDWDRSSRRIQFEIADLERQ